MDDVSDKWRDVENKWTLDFLVYDKTFFLSFSTCHVICVYKEMYDSLLTPYALRFALLTQTLCLTSLSYFTNETGSGLWG